MNLAFLILIVAIGRSLPFSTGKTIIDPFDWSSLESLPSLQYQACYDGFECARLLVPQNWNKTDDGRYASLAVIKLPAGVSQTDPRYGGTIITNPGGPGGSGVSDLLIHGQYLQNIVSGKKRFDLLSFDPRGVFHSVPAANCFENGFARRLFAFQQREIGLLDEDPSVLKRRRALVQAFGRVCENPRPQSRSSRSKDSDAQIHMSTAVVARDMLEIVEQTWRRRHKSSVSAIRPNEQEAKLQYLGFSYGTHLGNTFASMFPNRVEAMVLDGVVDSYDYSNGMWSKNLFDTEAAVDNFYQSCFEAGSSCMLATPEDFSGNDIKNRVEAFLDNITESPEVWLQNEFSEVITAQVVRDLFLIPIYMPLSFYQSLSQSLKAVLDGNYTSIIPDLERDGPLAPDLCQTPPGGQKMSEYDWDFESSLTYICNDGRDLSNMSNADLERYIAKLKDLSPTVGPYWAQFGLTCSGWKIRPAWRYAGPFGRNVSKSLYHPITFTADRSVEPESPNRDQRRLNFLSGEDKQSPVLFLSSRIDPVTPLRNAVAMSALHPGSSVVVQESVGHCATYSAPSKCTKKIVEAYFADGTMPVNGSICAPDCQPWDADEKCRSFDKVSIYSSTRDIWHDVRRLPLFYL